MSCLDLNAMAATRSSPRAKRHPCRTGPARTSSAPHLGSSHDITVAVSSTEASSVKRRWSSRKCTRMLPGAGPGHAVAWYHHNSHRTFSGCHPAQSPLARNQSLLTQELGPRSHSLRKKFHGTTQPLQQLSCEIAVCGAPVKPRKMRSQSLRYLGELSWHPAENPPPQHEIVVLY